MAARKTGTRGRALEIQVVFPKELARLVTGLTDEQRAKLEGLFQCALLYSVNLPKSARTKVCKE